MVKFQSVRYERYGSAGIAVLHHMEHAAALGIEVILDAKRGDIGLTAALAASARLAGADWTTVSPYLGLNRFNRSSIRVGRFVLVRTSNPDSDAVQSLVSTMVAPWLKPWPICW